MGTFFVLMLTLFGALVCGVLFDRLRRLKEEFELFRREAGKRLSALERHGEITPAVSVERAVSGEPAPPPPVPVRPAEAVPAGRPAPRTPEARTPDPITEFFGRVRAYFTTGNTLVKVGVLLIFFGVSFLLKYAIELGMVPIELRLAGAALFALALVRLGWELRERRRDYGLVLQGGGIGVLILTTFVALRGYGLIPASLAFFLLVSFTAASVFLALRQDSKGLAAFGLLGGFLAPILASTGQGQHVVLFTYYLVLNLAVLAISRDKAWRELNLLGFAFTFVISTIWGALKYRPELYATTQPFLILFFLIYVAIPLVFARKKQPELRGYVDGTLVFGNSILTLVLQLELVKPFEYAGAFSALTLAAFYLFLSRYLLRHRRESYRTLAEAFVSIGVVFVTIAIPLAFDGLKTSAIWAFEAAGIYWIALQRGRSGARIFSTILLFATSVAFFLGPQRGSSDWIFLNTFFLSCLFMAVAACAISYFSGNHRAKLSPVEAWVPEICFGLGTLWWVYGGLYEIDRFSFPWWRPSGPDRNLLPRAYLLNAQLAYLTVGALIVFLAGRALEWRKPRLLAHSFFLVLIAAFLRGLWHYGHPFESLGYPVWISAFMVYYLILGQADQGPPDPRGLFFRLGHAGALCVLVGVFARELHWLGLEFVTEAPSWRLAAGAIVPVAAIWIVTEKARWLRWPLETHRSIYLRSGLAPVAGLTLLWLLWTNWSQAGEAEPLAYVPLLNPLELAHLGVLLTSSVWVVRVVGPDADPYKRRCALSVLGLVYFLWLNGVLCRAVHHYAAVPFQFHALFDSVIVQVSFSLFWTLLGIALMLVSTRRSIRWLWLTGAGLLGLVVVKMFLIDLSKTETIARVVSFIGVGVLFLIVGYFSPIPPKAESTNA